MNHWPTGFASDITCIGRGSGEASTHFPGALIRGGYWSDSTGTGPFALNALNQPSASVNTLGFRGAR